MTSILEGLTFLTHELAKKDKSLAKREAQDLLGSILKCDRSTLYTRHSQDLSLEEWQTCQNYLKRRMKGEPLAYIQGSIDFYGCSIQVNPFVLIPRQETEILVDKISTYLSHQKKLSGKILWDLCSGSGCIGIALKKKFPQLHVISSDLSSAALSLARSNAQDNQVEVEFLQGDLLEPFEGRRAHFIICNPPYISEAEFKDLDLEVKEFEPKMALVGGETGLEIYQRLAEILPNYLYPHAKIWFEIGYKQGDSLKKIFKSSYWKRAFLENDWAGHHRFFFLENE
ncbi:peptide chain release factor N(5)-glutamine methyltransferase [Candidatus Protochlamydia amoebophila]|uniref:Release factor glutamine methyltransferase n=1 Tax=Protochlamydia amoebophila (strain UWE25) TaxID=264201 RepID=A0A2P9H9K5_PARUW|nr:peptide chain release factor N(5)-glutamine methyltransferase [Candidatus Protochlamydia amoebophila]SPJ31678.1 unnamed protein product [Candidatus Protochlamydia amoebophila UWE25]